MSDAAKISRWISRRKMTSFVPHIPIMEHCGTSAEGMLLNHKYCNKIGKAFSAWIYHKSWLSTVLALSRKESHLGKKKCCFPLYFLGCVKMCKNKLRWGMVSNHGCIWRNMYLFYICWFPKTCGKQPQLDYLDLSQYLVMLGWVVVLTKRAIMKDLEDDGAFPQDVYLTIYRTHKWKFRVGIIMRFTTQMAVVAYVGKMNRWLMERACCDKNTILLGVDSSVNKTGYQNVGMIVW